ncbi:hypothetical protein M127_0942 [Bacteroides fragilis str. S6L5]|nr:hypothetical protein M127_0942 [Bacteroides fragilis str. S6L5]
MVFNHLKNTCSNPVRNNQSTKLLLLFVSDKFFFFFFVCSMLFCSFSSFG